MHDSPTYRLNGNNINTNLSTNSSNSNNSSSNNNNNQFICGVVEGFYGKPWTPCQRKDLFKRLKEFNLNSFMYAPKDDAKHRAKWRQLYDESEALELKSLIEEAAANGIDFYYSLAPGLDMIYSDQEDIDILCRKFDQLKSLGCKSYAILFDDIEPSLTNEKDRVIFNDNYASAQVSIANLIYNHLDKPKFLFCPTEYCETRAVPNVLTSTYLNTIGTGLHNAIDIMWSGPRVVSRYITEESIRKLNSVIRRPALIWENLHANDYDKKRVYLGPYSGRSTNIIPQLRGVLTNPNCEYEANYIAIHTLAQWSRCTQDASQGQQCNQSPATTTTSIDHIEQANDTIYDPGRALLRAIRDWLPHVLSTRSLPQGFDMSANNPRSDETASDQMTKEELKASSLQVVDHGAAKTIDVEEDMPDASQSSPFDKSPSESTESKSDMDTSCSPVAPKNVDTNSCDSCEMPDASDLDERHQDPVSIGCIACAASQSLAPGVDEQDCTSLEQHHRHLHKVDIDSLALLVDFFYLPFEHGTRGHAFLKDIKWLIDHSDIFAITQTDDAKGVRQDESSPKADQVSSGGGTSGSIARVDSKLIELWTEKAEKLNNFCICIYRIIDSLLYDCPNKLIMVELYPYLIDLRDVIIMITDYMKFLRYRKSSLDRFHYSGAPKRREFASSDEQEPWVHRGGLIGDVQRLIS